MQEMTMNRYSNWMNCGTEEVFFWHHIPKKNCKNVAVIIIGPIGPEYISCHRSIKLLAEQLSHSGFHSIRYDPIGMGNSSGTLDDENIWSKWKKTPVCISEFLTKKFEYDDVILIGLRSGCILLSEVLNQLPTKTIILWHPIIKGTTFIRSIQLLDSVLYEDSDVTNNNILEGGGYPFTEALQSEIKKIDLLSQDYTNIKNTLLINSQSNKHPLKDILHSIGSKIDSYSLDGLDDMIKQVTLSKIPYTNIEIIVNWLNEYKTFDQINPPYPTSISPKLSTNFYCETIVNIKAKRKIFGILTTPNKQNINKIVIFVNTGAAHHTGPNRIHVDASRILSTHGITTLRIDLSNLGESTECYDIDPPEEYPDTATADINYTINFIDELLPDKDIILCGISAGATNIFHASLKSTCKNLRTLILINPETFYLNPNQTIFSPENTKTEIEQFYYKKQIYNHKKWIDLVTNPRKIYNTSLFSSLFILRKFNSFLLKFINLIGIKVRSRLEKDITTLGENKIAIDLVHSEDDPGYHIVKSQASKITKKHQLKDLFSSSQADDADHTFSSFKSRQELYKILTRIITKAS